jgi:hypothetical protein
MKRHNISSQCSGYSSQGQEALRPVEEGVRRQKIPQIDSIQQLAAFWDTHDVTEFEDELEPVGDMVWEGAAELVVEPLQPSEVEAVWRIANSRGIGYDALIREWVIQKLHTS